MLWKRKCVNPNDTDDICEKYTTTFQTTVIPLIIGLTLFFLLGIVLFVIVRKQRIKRKAEEAAQHKAIDDEMELEFAVSGHKHERSQGQVPPQYRVPDLENPVEGSGPPPKY
ncbi:uncharacterized protein PV06_08940 [Exophiala oligosperma]|uniref:Uncharacterized protein n=2 Tax=Chaetothyriales TaxID=34395 RepID=A0A0D2BNP9_9EURO|nr:uncharacterized protein PV06_08940 [Exophiala oligosperma]KAJ9611010.1 hypothetical protein H2204_015276 [Knufia peltigerae]KIW39137.1 hypothetical protein PV06_08940 [Exophiala oligosperma]